MEHFGVQRQTSRPGGKWSQEAHEQPRWHHKLFAFPQVSPCIFSLLWRPYSCRLVWWSIRQAISYLECSGRKGRLRGGYRSVNFMLARQERSPAFDSKCCIKQAQFQHLTSVAGGSRKFEVLCSYVRSLRPAWATCGESLNGPELLCRPDTGSTRKRLALLQQC